MNKNNLGNSEALSSHTLQNEIIFMELEHIQPSESVLPCSIPFIQHY